METLEQILDRVEAVEKTPFVTAQFGNDWKEWAKEFLDPDSILRIAHKQGRIALLLEKEIAKLLNENL